jgi:predicted nucleic acid-binding protein
MTMNNNFALDTNILIYLHESNSLNKYNIALDLVLEKPIISGQVVSEYINVLKRVFKIPKSDLIAKIIFWLQDCQITPIELSTLQKSKQLMDKYDFQIFDSLIVASALEAGCETLYSEDMQHSLRVENQLQILNPFL